MGRSAVFRTIVACLLISSTSVWSWECQHGGLDILELGIGNLMKVSDTNGDGKLSPVEASKFIAIFNVIDKMNQEDGFITKKDMFKFMGCK